MKLENKLKKITSIVLLLIWIVSDSAWTYASPLARTLPSQSHEIPVELQLRIPSHLASIQEVFYSPDRPQAPWIFYIQTAHGHPAIQFKVAELLRFLEEKANVRRLLLEGAVHDLNPSNFHASRRSDKNITAAKYLVSQGQMTGADYYLLNSKKTVRALGIEDPSLYREDLELLRSVLAADSITQPFLLRMESRLDLLMTHLASPDFRRLLQEWEYFQEDRRDFFPHLKTLQDSALSILKLDLHDLFAQIKWPQLTRLLVLEEARDSLDLTKAMAQKKEVLDFLSSKPSFQKIQKDVENLALESLKPEAASDASLHTQTPAREILETLAEAVRPYQFNLGAYPDFLKAAGLLILGEELDSRKLSDEMDLLFNTLLDSMTLSPAQKKLLQACRDIAYLKKLFRLELSRKEWSEKPDFNLSNLLSSISYLERLLPSQNKLRNISNFVIPDFPPYSVDGSAFSLAEIRDLRQKTWRDSSTPPEHGPAFAFSFAELRRGEQIHPTAEKHFGTDSANALWRTKLDSGLRQNDKYPDSELHNVNALLQKATKFYALAVRRENSFQDHLTRDFQSSKGLRSTLVTGGFHTEGVKKFLRLRGYHYAILTPAAPVDAKQGRALYHQAMIETPPPGYRKAALETASFHMRPEDQEALGFRSEIRSAQIARALAETKPGLSGRAELRKHDDTTPQLDPSQPRIKFKSLTGEDNATAKNIYESMRLAKQQRGQRILTGYDITVMIRRKLGVLRKVYPIPIEPGRLRRTDSIGIGTATTKIVHKWMEYREDGNLYQCVTYTKSSGQTGTAIFYFDSEKKQYFFLRSEEADLIDCTLHDLDQNKVPQRILFEDSSEAVDLTIPKWGALGGGFPNLLGKPLEKRTTFLGSDIKDLISFKPRWIEYRKNGRIYLCFSYQARSEKSGTIVFYWDGQDYVMVGSEAQDAVHVKLSTLLDQFPKDTVSARIKPDAPLIVSDFTYLSNGAFKVGYPLSEWRELNTKKAFGAVKGLKQVEFMWAERRQDNKIYSCYHYVTSSGERGSTVIREEGDTYVSVETEEEDALRTAFAQFEGTKAPLTVSVNLDLTHTNPNFASAKTGSFGPHFLKADGKKTGKPIPLGIGMDLRSLVLTQIEQRDGDPDHLYLTIDFQKSDGTRDKKIIGYEQKSQNYSAEPSTFDDLLGDPQMAALAADFTASGDLDMLLYCLLFVRKFDPKRAPALVRESVLGLAGEQPWAPNLSNHTPVPGEIKLNSTTFSTEDPTLLIKGEISKEARGHFTHIRIGKDRTRLVEINPDGSFQTRIFLKRGDILKLDLTPFHNENKTKGKTTRIEIEQTSSPQDLAEVLHHLINRKKGLLADLAEDSFRYKYLQRKMEVSLLKRFMENEKSAFEYLESKINPPSGSEEASLLLPEVRDFYERIQKKMAEVQQFEIPDLKESTRKRIKFYQRYVLHETWEIMDNPRARESGDAARLPGIIHALEQGLGKTLVALILAHKSIREQQKKPDKQKPRGALVITYNSLTSNWRNEEKKFFEEDKLLTVLIKGKTSKAKTRKLKKTDPDTIRIVSLEFLRTDNPTARKTRLEALNIHPQQMVIFDESQFLKNPHSLQSQTARGILGAFRLFVSATPISNPLSAQPILEALTGDKAFGASETFQDEMLKKEGSDALRLIHFMLDPFMIRILEQQVMGTFDPNQPLEDQYNRLPALNWIEPEESGEFEFTLEQSQSMLELLVDWPTWSRRKTELTKQQRAANTLDDQKRAKKRKQKDLNPSAVGLAKLQALIQLRNPWYAGIRQDSPKAARVNDIVNSEVNPNWKDRKGIEHHRNGKVLIFTSYQQEVVDYQKQFKDNFGAVSYYGNTGRNGEKIGPHGYVADGEGYLVAHENGPRVRFQQLNGEPALTPDGIPMPASPDEPGEAMTALDYNCILFQNNPSTKVMVVTYETGAFGKTFTEADAAIFDNPPRDFLQLYHAYKRNNRMDDEREKYEQRCYKLIGKYPEKFLNSLRGLYAVVDRATEVVSYVKYESLTPEMLDNSQHRLIDLETEFRRGTYDEIQFRNLHSQGRELSLMMNGFLTPEDLELMTRATLKESMPLLFETHTAASTPEISEKHRSHNVQKRRRLHMPSSLESARTGEFADQKYYQFLQDLGPSLYQTAFHVQEEIKIREALGWPSDWNSLATPGTMYSDPTLAFASKRLGVSLPEFPKDQMNLLAMLRAQRFLGFPTNFTRLASGYYSHLDAYMLFRKVSATTRAFDPYPLPSDVKTELANRRRLRLPSDSESLKSHPLRGYDPRLLKAAVRWGIPLDTPEEAAQLIETEKRTPLQEFFQLYPTPQRVEAARDERHRKGWTFKGSELLYSSTHVKLNFRLEKAARFHKVPLDPEDRYTSMSEISAEVNQRTEKKLLSTRAALLKGAHRDPVLLYQLENTPTGVPASVSMSGQVPPELRGKTLQGMNLQLRAAYRILGIRWGASPKEVRDAFLARVTVYHPQQMTDKGLQKRGITRRESNDRYEAAVLAKDFILGETRSARTTQKLYVHAVRQVLNGNKTKIITYLDGLDEEAIQYRRNDRLGIFERVIKRNAYSDVIENISAIVMIPRDEVVLLMPFIVKALEKNTLRATHHPFRWLPEPLGSIANGHSPGEDSPELSPENAERSELRTSTVVRENLKIQAGKISETTLRPRSIEQTASKISRSANASGILVGWDGGLLERMLPESPEAFAAAASFKVVRAGDQKTVEELARALIAPESSEDRIWKSALPVPEGIGAVIRVWDRLPTPEEERAMRLALRNPNHRETWIVLTNQNGNPEIASYFDPRRSALRPEHSRGASSPTAPRNDKNGIMIKIANSSAQLFEILKSLSQDQFKTMAKLAAETHQPRPNVSASFVLAAPPAILDQIESARLGALVIETPDQTNAERRMAQHLLTADIADELHQAEQLREQTLQSLIRNGTRHAIKSSSLDIFTARIQSALAKTAHLNRSA